jgi:hypothetical protein
MSARDSRLRIDGETWDEEYARRRPRDAATLRDQRRAGVYPLPMTNLKPVPKVQAAGISGTLTAVLVIVANAVGLDLPPEGASAIVLLGTLAGGYWKRDKAVTPA